MSLRPAGILAIFAGVFALASFAAASMNTLSPVAMIAAGLVMCVFNEVENNGFCRLINDLSVVGSVTNIILFLFEIRKVVAGWGG